MFRLLYNDYFVYLRSDKRIVYSDRKNITIMEKEIWKNVVRYEDLYQISSNGRVRTKPRIVVDSLGRKIPKKEQMIKIVVSKTNGYPYVNIYRDGKSRMMYIHRLIAEAFIPNPNNLPCVNHKDQNRGNSVLSNLEWCTYSYNNTYGEANIKRKNTLRKTLDGKHKTIYQFDLNGKLVRCFTHGVNQFEEILGYSIQDCLNGRCKTSHNFVFSYNSTFSYTENKKPKHQKNVYLIDDDGEILEEYDSVSTAGKKNGFDRHCFSRSETIDGVITIKGKHFIVEKKDNEYIPKGHKGSRPDLIGKGTKRVCQYTKEGNFVKDFQSIKDAAKSLGVIKAAAEISNCCNGKLKTARGFIWRFYGEPAPKPFKNDAIRKIRQYTVDGVYVATYNSIKEAAKTIGGGTATCIGNNLAGRSHSAYGYVWRYSDE